MVDISGSTVFTGFVAPSRTFKTSAFNHSAISPGDKTSVSHYSRIPAQTDSSLYTQAQRQGRAQPQGRSKNASTTPTTFIPSPTLVSSSRLTYIVPTISCVRSTGALPGTSLPTSLSNIF